MIDVVILAGGRGTRARSYLCDTPKAAAIVRGKPLIVHQLEWLAASRIVSRVVLALGIGTDAVKRATSGFPEILPTCSIAEAQPLGTASAVRNALKWVSSTDPFGVLNGDTLLDLDLAAMVERHRAGTAAITAARTGDTDAGLYLLSSIARTYLTLTTTGNFSDYVRMLGAAAYPAKSFIDIGTEDGWRRANAEAADPYEASP